MSDIAETAPTVHAGDIGPRGTEQGPRRPSNRRELILGAAIDHFHRHGYHATGIDDIGQAVDVSGPAIYRHFASKEDILVDAVALAADRVHAANESARAQESDPAALMESYVRAFARVAIDEAPLIRVWVSEVRHLSPERRSPMTRRIRAWTEEWVDVLTDWRPDLSAEEARLLVAGAIGLITTVATANASPRDNLEGRVTDMALATLAAPVREPR
jgi:AcrR family transcriptional regulator